MNSTAKQILIVDDDEAVRAMLKDCLSEAGYRVHEAVNGSQALALLEKNSIRFVITDLKMPVLDGFGVLRHIRRRCPHIPVAVITGFSEKKDAIQALREGAVDFIEKPFPLEQVLNVVGRSFREQEMLAENRRLEEKVHEQQKLEVALQMAGMIHHRLNQPLTVLNGSLSLFRHFKKQKPDSYSAELEELIAAMERATKNMIEMVEKISSIYRLELMPYAGEEKIVDLEASAKESK